MYSSASAKSTENNEDDEDEKTNDEKKKKEKSAFTLAEKRYAHFISFFPAILFLHY